MRLRLLVFFPIAAVATFVLMAASSSLVSALERSWLTGVEQPPAPIPITRYETECEGLYREIHTLSHEVTACQTDPECTGSPLLCPVVMDVEVEREYRRLRDALHERCDVSLALMNQVWGGPASSGPEKARPTCGEAHDWLEARANGQAEVVKFVF